MFRYVARHASVVRCFPHIIIYPSIHQVEFTSRTLALFPMTGLLLSPRYPINPYFARLIPIPPTVTAYLDNTCSMPTSRALTSTIPCYFLGPTDLIGSFEARCLDGATSTTSNSSTTPGEGPEGGVHDQHQSGGGEDVKSSAPLEDVPASGARPVVGALPGRWMKLVVQALVSTGVAHVAWSFVSFAVP